MVITVNQNPPSGTCGNNETFTITYGPATAPSPATTTIYTFNQTPGGTQPTVTATADTTAPSVTSINRQSPLGANTNTSPVTFRVTFSENVTGVDATDFSLTLGAGNNLTGSTIGVVSPVSGSVYDVPVSTTGGNGTIRLDLNDNDSIADSAGNKLGGTGTGTAGGGGAGNGSRAGDQLYTVDRTNPTATITSNPANPTNSTSASFGFTTTDPTAGGVSSGVLRAECQLDGGGFSTCTSPQVYSSLAATSHTFDVRAVDNAGNTGSVASFIWTIDTTAPSVTSINRQSPLGANTNTSPVTFRVTFSENVTGVDATDFSLTLGAGNNLTGSTIGVVSPVSGSVYDVPVSTTGGNGTIRLDLNDNDLIADSAGNKLGGTGTGTAGGGGAGNGSRAGDQLYTVDRTNPTATITSNPANPTNSTSASFGFTTTDPTAGGVSSGVLRAECQLDGGGFSTCTSPQVYGSLAATSHTFDVRAVDNAGNTGSVASFIWTIDTTAPSVTSINRQSPLGANTNTSPVTFRVTFSENVTGVDATDFSLTLGAGNNLTGSTIGVVSPVSGSVYDVPVSTTGGNGTIRLDLNDNNSIADSAGNKLGGTGTGTAGGGGAGNGSRAGDQLYTVDRTNPTATITSNPANPTNSTSASFGFTTTDPTAGGVSSGVLRAECQLDGGGFSTCTSPQVYGSLAATSHTFDVRAVDNAGNTGSVASFIWTIDTTAPTVTIVSVVPNPTNSGTTVTWHANESGSFSVRIGSTDCSDGATVASGSYSTNPSDVSSLVGAGNLTEGSNGIRVCVTDAATNTGLATSNVNKDTAPPTSSASSPGYATSPSFSVSYLAADPGVNPSGLDTVEIFVKVPGAGSYVSAHLFSSAAASGSFTYTAVDGDGNYAFYSVATDKAGNVEVSPLSPDTTTLLDTQQPNSQITFPVDGGNYNSATFTGGCGTVAGDICGTAADPLKNGSASGVALVEISIKQASSTKYWDGIGFNNLTETFVAAATSDGWAHWSYNFGTPAEGQYTIHSRTTDAAGNVETSFDTATFNEVHLNIDNTAPSSLVGFPANGANLTSTAYNAGCGGVTPDVCGSATDPGTSPSGLDKVEVAIQRANGQYWNGVTWQGGIVWNTASGTTSWSYGFSPAADDTYTVTSRATDKATNVESPSGSHTFTIDDTPPTSSASSPGYATSPSFSVSYLAADPGVNPSGLDTVEIFVKVPGAGSYVSAHLFSSAAASGSFTYTAVDGRRQLRLLLGRHRQGRQRRGQPAGPRHDDPARYPGADLEREFARLLDVDGFSVSYTASDPLKSGSVGPASGLDTVEIFVKAPGAGSYVSAHRLQLGRGQRQLHLHRRRRSTATTTSTSSPTTRPATSRPPRLSPDTRPWSIPSSRPRAPARPPTRPRPGFTVTYTASDPLKNGSTSGLDKVELYVNPGRRRLRPRRHHISPAAASGSFTFTAVDGDGNYDFYSSPTTRPATSRSARWAPTRRPWSTPRNRIPRSHSRWTAPTTTPPPSRAAAARWPATSAARPLTRSRTARPRAWPRSSSHQAGELQRSTGTASASTA